MNLHYVQLLYYHAVYFFFTVLRAAHCTRMVTPTHAPRRAAYKRPVMGTICSRTDRTLTICQQIEHPPTAPRCMVCWEHDAQYAFLSCGHFGVCEICHPTGKKPACYICKSDARLVKIYCVLPP